MGISQITWGDNTLKVTGQQPSTLTRSWASITKVMSLGTLDPLFKKPLCIDIGAANALIEGCQVEVGQPIHRAARGG